jgi:hypothetical protein
MSDVQHQRSFSVGAFVLMVIATGLATWLCIGWFGAQGPLAAAVGVMLVELFLACLGVIVLLLAARLMEAYLLGEARASEQPARSRGLWLWRPIWLPQPRWNTQADEDAPKHSSLALTPVGHWLRRVHDELRPLDDLGPTDSSDGPSVTLSDAPSVTLSDELPVMLQFPIAAGDRSPADRDPGDALPHRRAA